MNNFLSHVNKVNGKNRSFSPIPINSSNKSQTQQVIIRFTNWNARSRVYQLHYEKGIKISVKCDLTKTRIDILSHCRKFLDDNRYDGYVYNDAECRMILKNPKLDKKLPFSTFAEFRELAGNLAQAERPPSTKPAPLQPAPSPVDHANQPSSSAAQT